MTYTIFDNADNSLSVMHHKGEVDLHININDIDLFNIQKNQLEELIGALLHIQSKIRKESGYVK